MVNEQGQEQDRKTQTSVKQQFKDVQLKIKRIKKATYKKSLSNFKFIIFFFKSKEFQQLLQFHHPRGL